MCGCEEGEKVLDPVTGLYVSVGGCGDCGDDCDCEDEHEHATPQTTSPVVPTPVPKSKLSVSLGDLFSPECVCQCVNLAVLFNYEGEKNDTEFAEVFLPELKIDYSALTKIFFNDFGKSFSGHILDKIWGGLTNFSLANTVLEKYEEINDIDRDKIAPVKMIQLHKECAIKKITKIAKRVVALKLSEFTNALSSVDVREDGNICANITFNLFFNSLDIGVKLTLRFAISDVPQELIGKLSEDDKAVFDFGNVNNEDDSVSIIFEKPVVKPLEVHHDDC